MATATCGSCETYSGFCEVMLLIQRMCADWDKMHPTLRKAWNARDTANLHAVCGGFLHYVGLLEKKIAKHDFDTTIAGIQEQFMSGHLDIDISHAMESSPFPGQLEDVGFLRSWFGSVVEGMLFQIMVSQTSNFVFFYPRAPGIFSVKSLWAGPFLWTCSGERLLSLRRRTGTYKTKFSGQISTI